MTTADPCARCGSKKVIPNVHLKDRSTNLNTDHSLTAEVYEHPEALLFRGAHQARLTARICGECGFADLYVENPQDLWAAYARTLRGKDR